MIYKFDFDKDKTQISANAIDAEYKTCGIVSLEELEEHNKIFGLPESVFTQCRRNDHHFRNLSYVFDDYSFYVFDVIHMKATGQNYTFHNPDRVGFLIKKNLFLIVDITDIDGSTKESFQYALNHFNTGTITIEKMVYSTLDHLLMNDYNVIQDMEFRINALEETVVSGKATKDFNKLLLLMKKELLILHNYYEQLIGMGEELMENSNTVFCEKELRYFKLFTDRITRFSSDVELMRESLVELREAYDSFVSLEQNNIMKIFTVVTVIFMPLTLIVGWYGMNFKNIPELQWKYGYLGVSILSIICVIVCIWIFKKKKLF